MKLDDATMAGKRASPPSRSGNAERRQQQTGGHCTTYFPKAPSPSVSKRRYFPTRLAMMTYESPATATAQHASDERAESLRGVRSRRQQPRRRPLRQICLQTAPSTCKPNRLREGVCVCVHPENERGRTRAPERLSVSASGIGRASAFVRALRRAACKRIAGAGRAHVLPVPGVSGCAVFGVGVERGGTPVTKAFLLRRKCEKCRGKLARYHMAPAERTKKPSGMRHTWRQCKAGPVGPGIVVVIRIRHVAGPRRVISPGHE